MTEDLDELGLGFNNKSIEHSDPYVKLIKSTDDAPLTIAAALLFPHCNAPLHKIKEQLEKCSSRRNICYFRKRDGNTEQIGDINHHEH